MAPGPDKIRRIVIPITGRGITRRRNGSSGLYKNLDCPVLATLGYKDDYEWETVTERDLALGYGTSRALAGASTQILATMATGKVSGRLLMTKCASGAGTAARIAGATMVAAEGVQSAKSVYAGATDAYYNGLSVENGIQMAGGALGAVGGVSQLKAGMSQGAYSFMPCFPAGTPVATPSGLKPIETLQPSDEVLAFDEVASEVVARRIEQTHVKTGSGDMVELRTDAGTESITATGGHPFLVISEPDATDTRAGLLYEGRSDFAEGRWIQARDLRVGDQVRLASEVGSATVVAHRSYDDTRTVYNLTVEQAHTYSVGSEQCVVHNDCGSNARALRKNLASDGRPVLAGEAAHHIVASGDVRAAGALQILKDNGIGINDAINGVGLPRFRKSWNPFGKTVHSPLHTDYYFRTVTARLRAANRNGTVRDELILIQQELTKGSW